MKTQAIHIKAGQLSEDLQQEVLDYIEFLLHKHAHEVKKEHFRFDWEGGLSDFKAQYTSVDLQHKALEWR